MSTIHLRLEEIGGDSDAIQLNRKPIATFFLWATRIDILSDSQRFDWQSDITRHQFLELWDRIHLTNPAPATFYLDALLSYLNVDQGRITERPGSTHAARVASMCLLRALSGVDPTSSVLEDLRQSYTAVIPYTASFEGLHCYHAINAIHAVLVRSKLRGSLDWTDHRPHAEEHIFTSTLARVAHNGKQHGKVPRWLLRFVIHSLPNDPQPPILVIIDCLMVIAIDLGCDVSEDDVRDLDKRYACRVQLHNSSS